MGSTNPLTYKGTKTVDGIAADMWSTTIKWSSDNDVLNVDYYFTPDNWKLKGYSDIGSALPLRIEVNGNHVAQDGTKKNIHHYYEYVNFETSDRLPTEAFSIPDGEACYISKGTKIKPVPMVPDAITYSREIIDKDGNVNFEEVVHDKKRGFLKVTSDIDIFYDFNDGVRYSVDTSGTCKTRAINPSLDPETRLNGLYVQDSGPSELSLLKNPFVFTGQKITRLVDSYSWGGNIDSKPFDVHFANLNWNYPGYNSSSSPPPLSMIIDNKQYNFFDFKPTTSYLLSTDWVLESCRADTEVKRFRIMFHSDKSYIPHSTFYLMKNQDLFLTAISKAAGVNYLHVSFYSERSLRWDDKAKRAYVNIALFGPTEPQYLYRRANNFAVSNPRSLQKVSVSTTNFNDAIKKGAQLCENNALSGKFMCRNFDLCKNNDGSYVVKMYLALSKTEAVTHSSTCNHFARSVDSKPGISLEQAKTNLNNAIQKGTIKFKMNYITSYGYRSTATLTAFAIDSNTNYRRDRTTRLAFNKFKYQKGASIIKTEVLSQVQNSVDCANQCLGRTEYECKAYALCPGTNQCILSKSYPQTGTPTNDCGVRGRRYTADFQAMNGRAIATADQVQFKNIRMQDCALKCLKYTKYKCESFDYCIGAKSCVIHGTHVYSLPPTQVLNVTKNACYHFSKKYLLDFQVSKHTALVSDNAQDLQIVSVSGPSECAYLCRTGYSGQGCVQFDYCSSSKQCHIASGARQKYVGHVGKSGCDTFTLAVNTNIAAQASSSSSVSYSNGSFAGLAIAMIIIGLALGALVMYVLYKRNVVQKIIGS